MVGSAGWLVSPRLKFEAAQDYEVSFEYTLTGDEADAPALGVYVAPVNNPSEFTLVQSFAPTAEGVKANCVIPAIENGGERYVAIRPTMESTKNAYTASVKSFRVAKPTTTSIDSIADGTACIDRLTDTYRQSVAAMRYPSFLAITKVMRPS